ncbi:MAG TPA: hypothetical protein VGV12_12605 [Gemmatimonadales bacterium]|nr:hypothetical protein [Gemmatimonadales bacterium]
MPGLAILPLTVRLPDDAYLLQLRALGAWWNLGSSVLEPQLLLRYGQARLRTLREAGL